jgi:hypothetical protein
VTTIVWTAALLAMEARDAALSAIDELVAWMAAQLVLP